MKILLINLLVISFLGISVLGFVTMDHGSSSGFKNCATEMATGLNCPANPLAFADFHLNLLRVFSSVHLGELFNTFSTSMALLMLGLIFILFGHNYFNVSRVRFYGSERSFGSFIPLTESKICHWLSLHENSPTAQ